MSPLKVGMFNILLIFGCLAFPFTHADSQAAGEEFSATQKVQIEKIVHDYLIKQPQVLVEASQELQKQQQQSIQQQAQSAIAQNIQNLFHNPLSPVAGNAKGTAVIVEFFDYQCGHCKRVAPALAAMLKADPQVSVILKQLPIFGATSEYAATAVLAAQKQNKAWALHQALMTAKQPLSEKLILEAATANGLDVAALKKEMQNPAYAAEFKNNGQLADKLGIMGTPAFVVASGITDKSGKALKVVYIPGAADQAELEKAVAQVRAK